MPRICILPVLICASAVLTGATVSPRELAAPAYFEPAQGQGAFLVRGAAYPMFLDPDGGAVYPFPSGTIRLELAGRSTPARLAAEQPLPGVTRYYGGPHPREGRTAPHYASVRVRGVYPGVDMLWRCQGPELEYEFQLAAGADPRRIQLRIGGAGRLRLDGGGDLLIETASGQLRQRRPVAWQEIAGRRRDVPVRFHLAGGGVTFQLGPYDHRQALRIDPVLSYSSYLGGGGFDTGYAVAVDASGKISLVSGKVLC